jgi:16S rRNA (guanine1207-N2)-methyltransferase
VDHYFAAEPASADQRREISVVLDGYPLQVETAPGVFSPGHVDLGTSVLLDTVGTPPAGKVLDLGCGWGPIALTAAIRMPAAHVYAVDVNERALDLVSRNATRVAARVDIAPISALLPDAVAPDLVFDALWSNPPIRIGKTELHDLLSRWVPRVKPGGEVWLVVQKNLGADSLAAWIARQTDDAGVPWGTIEKVRSSKGFRILRLTRTR